MTPENSPLTEVVQKPLMALLGKYKGQITAVLPKQFDSERVLKLIVGAINRTPDLLKCTPISVVNAVLTAASIGLEIRPGMAYLIPFKKSYKKNGEWASRHECQLVIDYRGKIDLALRSGKVMDVDPDVVYSRDKFKIYRDETGMKCVEHEPILFRIGENGDHLPIEEKDRGVPIGVLVVAPLKDSKPKVLFMPRIDILKIRDRSKAKEDGPWVTDELEMWKKTAVHRICKTLPQSPEMAIANQVDDTDETGVTFDVIDIDALDAGDDKPLLEQSEKAAQDVAQRKIAELEAARDARKAAADSAPPAGPPPAGDKPALANQPDPPHIPEVTELQDAFQLANGERCLYQGRLLEARDGEWKAIGGPAEEKSKPSFKRGGAK